MSETISSLQHKIESAGELESVVRTMKAVSASNISQYEKALRSLNDYFHTVEMGLFVSLRQLGKSIVRNSKLKTNTAQTIYAIVCGSDQGLVGQFNDVLADLVVKTLSPFPIEKKIWAMGERMQGRIEDASLKVEGAFPVPSSVSAITPLIGRILVECEAHRGLEETATLYLFYNAPKSAAVYEPTCQKLLPLDESWLKKITEQRWTTNNLAQVIGNTDRTLKALIGEYLFVSLYKACAESLASENASRLAAMQRAEKNIDEMLESLNRKFHHLRQSSIDEELFDVVSGFESHTR